MKFYKKIVIACALFVMIHCKCFVLASYESLSSTGNQYRLQNLFDACKDLDTSTHMQLCDGLSNEKSEDTFDRCKMMQSILVMKSNHAKNIELSKKFVPCTHYAKVTGVSKTFAQIKNSKQIQDAWATELQKK